MKTINLRLNKQELRPVYCDEVGNRVMCDGFARNNFNIVADNVQLSISRRHFKGAKKIQLTCVMFIQNTPRLFYNIPITPDTSKVGYTFHKLGSLISEVIPNMKEDKKYNLYLLVT